MSSQTPPPDTADQAAPLDALLADAAELGGGGLRPLAAAPGTYVFGN